VAEELGAPPPVRGLFTSVADGDLGRSVDPDLLRSRRERLAPGQWTWLDQVHGADVVVVDRPGDRAGSPADAAVTAVPGAVLSVLTADCAPVLLWSLPADRTGPVVVGAAHAGWRGLLAGVLESCVSAMRELGADGIDWRLGPCVSPAAYEFSDADLDLVADRLGPDVRSTTSEGAPALDTRAAVSAALGRVGVDAPASTAPVPCTALDPGWFSWRARRDTGRQAAVIWIDGAA
jgi:YfiH family protein